MGQARAVVPLWVRHMIMGISMIVGIGDCRL